MICQSLFVLPYILFNSVWNMVMIRKLLTFTSNLS